MADPYFKELIKDKKSGKLVPGKAPSPPSRDTKGLDRQEQLDRRVMTKKAADAKWGDYHNKWFSDK